MGLFADFTLYSSTNEYIHKLALYILQMIKLTRHFLLFCLQQKLDYFLCHLYFGLCEENISITPSQGASNCFPAEILMFKIEKFGLKNDKLKNVGNSSPVPGALIC